MAPFGKKVINKNKSSLGLVANIIWLIFLGWELFIVNLLAVLFFTITIIGIPFAAQSWKLAKISLFPFSKDIVKFKKYNNE